MIYLQIFSGASNFVEGVDRSFAVIFGIALFFLIGITAVMIFFTIRYHKSRNAEATQIEGSNTLEIIWTVVPLILVMVMFYYGYKGFAIMRKVPENAFPVKVISYMWDWDFEYPNGKRAKDLYVPVNQPIKLNMVSLDVIHSLYIPAFRVKEDVVPGTDNFMWFIPQMKGEFDILCAEYCGLRHSFMDAKVYVMDQADFDTWLADFNPEENMNKGLDIIRNNACTGCHSLDGTKLVGTSFKGLYDSKRTVLKEGKEITLKADDEYIKRSIINPADEVVKGFQPNLMQSYEKVLTEKEIEEIILYLKSEELR